MGFYYSFLYQASWLTQSLPFLVALAIFYPAYQYSYRRHSARTRTKILVQSQKKGLRVLAIIIFVLSLTPVIVHQTFANEYIRIMIITSALAFSYWAHLHWTIRVAVSGPARLITSAGGNSAFVCN